MLLQNFSGLLANTMGLLNDIMVYVDYDGFSGVIDLVYFNHKWKTRMITPQEYLHLGEYRTMYRAQKWPASKNDPTSGFFIDDRKRDGAGDDGDGCGKSGVHGNNGYGGCDNCDCSNGGH